ncbi:MAG: hypothetical protein AAGJ82_09455 [Bacteroidota bacterium]
MLRYLFLVAVLSSSLVAFGQTTAAKASCTASKTQCQKKSATSMATTQQAATPVRAVANEPAAAPTQPTCTPSPACQRKATSTASTTEKPVQAVSVSQKDRASIPDALELPALRKNCDPNCCLPKQCRPSDGQSGERAATTQLAAKQD